MPAVYLCNVTGDGGSTETAYRPSLPAGSGYACMMIDEPKARALIVSPDNALAGTGIVKLLDDVDWAALQAKAQTTNPTAGQRTTVSNWLAANSYLPLTVAEVTWWDVIHFVARQVNPAADLSQTRVG